MVGTRQLALILLLVLALPALAAPPKVEIIAHRGAGQGTLDPDVPPENTLPAFEWAWRHGVDAAECDVHATLDGRTVVIHDGTTKRTTSQDWPVAERTFAELRTLDAGAWKGAPWAGTRLPSLEEILAIVPPGRRQFVEVKSGADTVPAVARAIRASGLPPSQVPVLSFREDVLRAAKTLLPDNPCYQLVEFEADYRAGAWKVNYGRMTADTGLDPLFAEGLDGVDVSFDGPLRAVAERSRAAGRPWIVWTVNDPDLAVEMARMGAHGITTDRPLVVRAALSEAGLVPVTSRPHAVGAPALE